MEGTFERLNAVLRERLRTRLGRNAQPSSAGIVVDSQSAKTTSVGGEQRGYDGGVRRCADSKRHLLVDTEGLVLKAKVHSAKVPDQDGLRVLLESARARLSRLKHLSVGRCRLPREGHRRWAQEVLGLSVEVVRKPQKPIPEKVAKASGLRSWPRRARRR